MQDEHNSNAVFGTKLWKGSMNLTFISVFKPHTRKLPIFRYCINIVYNMTIDGFLLETPLPYSIKTECYYITDILLSIEELNSSNQSIYILHNC